MPENRARIIYAISNAILEGEVNEVTAMIEKALQINIYASEILNEAILPATQKVADKFRGADFYIPDVIAASHAIQAGLYLLKPYTKTNSKRAKKIVIGTVEGDIHDIGKNVVILYLHNWAFEVIDLGVDVTVEKFVEAVKMHKPDVLAMSSLLTTTMGEMKNVIEALNKHHLRNSVKVLIGGGPITPGFALSIGADLYARNAQSVVNELKKLG